MFREYKAFAEVKFTEDSHGGFEGYASLFGVLDSGGDVIERGAFASSLGDFLKHGFIGLGHDWDGLAIGTVRDAYEDAHGLFLRGEYHSTPEAQAARVVAQERMARGKSVGLSIGYGINPEGMHTDNDGVRHLKSLLLYEVSQVNVPMLRPAGLTGVKGIGLNFEDHSRNLQVALDEWLERVRTGSDVRLKEGRRMSEARRIRLGGVLPALRSVQDVAGSAADEIEALLKETEPPETKPLEEPPPVDEPVGDPELRGLFDLAQFDALYGLNREIPTR